MGPATIAVITAVAATCLGAVGWLSVRGSEPPDTAPAPRAEPPVAATVRPTAAAPAAAHAAARPAPAPSMTAPTAGPRLQLRRLLASGSARDHLRAYALLAHCVHTRDFDRFVHALPAGAQATTLRARYGDGTARVAAACGDLSAQELDGRIALAAQAAEHGLPGAASAWVEEGPFGDPTALTQRPDDPIVIEWARRAITLVHAAAKRSDIEAIGQFGLLCLNWELDDVARVRLLVEAGAQRRRDERIGSLLE